MHALKLYNKDHPDTRWIMPVKGGAIYKEVKEIQESEKPETKRAKAVEGLRKVEAETKARNVARAETATRAKAIEGLRKVEAETKERNIARAVIVKKPSKPSRKEEEEARDKAKFIKEREDAIKESLRKYINQVKLWNDKKEYDSLSAALKKDAREGRDEVIAFQKSKGIDETPTLPYNSIGYPLVKDIVIRDEKIVKPTQPKQEPKTEAMAKQLIKDYNDYKKIIKTAKNLNDRSEKNIGYIDTVVAARKWIETKREQLKDPKYKDLADTIKEESDLFSYKIPKAVQELSRSLYENE